MDQCKTWVKEAIEVQEGFFYEFGCIDWDFYRYDELEYLHQKITYLFGSNKQHVELVGKLFDVIRNEDKHDKREKHGILMSFIFLCIRTDEGISCEPVFKVPKDLKGVSCVFIDRHSRVYQTWEYFLETNILPPCDYCYPTNGEYGVDEKNEIMLQFGKSPASQKSKKALSILDSVSTGVAGATTVVALASLALPVAPAIAVTNIVASAAVSAYSAVRSSSMLYDRSKHKQCIGLSNPDSRSCWLSIAGNSVGLAAMSASAVTTKLAQAGKVVGKAGCITVNAVNFGNITVNGLGVLNNAHFLHKKFKNNSLTHTDVLNFSASVLFFAHATVNLKTAEKIIQETQENVINEYASSMISKRQSKLFRKVIRSALGDRKERNAQIIRSLSYIKSKRDLHNALQNAGKNSEIENLPCVMKEKWVSCLITSVIGLAHSNFIKEITELLLKIPSVLYELILNVAKEISVALQLKNERLVEIIYIICGYLEGQKIKFVSAYSKDVNKSGEEEQEGSLDTFNKYVDNCFKVLNNTSVKQIVIAVSGCAETICKRFSSFKDGYKIMLFKISSTCDVILKYTPILSKIIDVVIKIHPIQSHKFDYFLCSLKILICYVEKVAKSVHSETQTSVRRIEEMRDTCILTDSRGLTENGIQTCVDILHSIENNEGLLQAFREEVSAQNNGMELQ